MLSRIEGNTKIGGAGAIQPLDAEHIAGAMAPASAELDEQILAAVRQIERALLGGRSLESLAENLEAALAAAAGNRWLSAQAAHEAMRAIAQKAIDCLGAAGAAVLVERHFEPRCAAVAGEVIQAEQRRLDHYEYMRPAITGYAGD